MSGTVSSTRVEGSTTPSPGRTLPGNAEGLAGRVRAVHPDAAVDDAGVITWTAADDGSLPVATRGDDGELTWSWPDGVAVHQERAAVGDHVLEGLDGTFRAQPPAA